MTQGDVNNWEALPGGATDIGVGPDGHVWAVGGAGVPHYWESFSPPNPVLGDWPVAPPNNLQDASRVAVGPDGLAWLVMIDGRIIRRVGSTFPGTGWVTLPGAATDIAIGADGHVWTIGGGGVPHYWESFSPTDPTSGDWPVAPPNNLQGAIRVAVGPDGLPWVVMSNGQIMQRTGSGFPGTAWVQFPGTATDIGIGADYTLWIAGNDGVARGWSWDDSDWILQPGIAATSISVGPDGQAWVIADQTYIYRWIAEG